jgi:hypothetical protein
MGGDACVYSSKQKVGGMLSGQDGARGYVYQGFAAVLEALTYEYWNELSVEFKSANDKVDIAVSSQGAIVKIIQVKSSINLFTRENIIKWLSELKKDFNSPEYSIQLIGNCDNEANKLIKSLRKINEGVEDGEVKKTIKELPKWMNKDKISIKVIPFCVENLESIVRDSLHKYIYNKGAIIDFEGLSLIANNVGMTMMLLSTQGEFISKESFDQKIYSGLKKTLGSYLKGNESKAVHTLCIYNQDGQMDNSKVAIPIKEFFVYKNRIQYLKSDSLKNIQFIKANTFGNAPKNIKVKEKQELEENKFSIAKAFTRPTVDNYLEPTVKEQKNYIELIEEVHGITLENDDFNLGDLREVTIDNFINKDCKIVGTKLQKEKKDAIDNLYTQLLDILLSESLLYGFDDFCCLPLAIKNTSKAPDSDINIKLCLPKEVRIFDSKEYKSDGLVESMPDIFVERGGLIDQVFDVKQDSVINVEVGKAIEDFRFMRESVPQINNLYGQCDTRYSKDDIYSILNKYFVTEYSKTMSKNIPSILPIIPFLRYGEYKST